MKQEQVLLASFRGENADYDDLMKVPILRYWSVESLELNLDRPTRYIVYDPNYSLPLDFLFVPRDRKRLLVGFHGAEMHKPDKFPKYQFFRSFMKRTESLLFPSIPHYYKAQR